MGMWKRISTLGLVGICVLLLAAEGIAQQGPSSQARENLKRRVEEYYTLLLSSRVADAEAYVTKDSVENFRRLKNNAFVSFKVKAVNLDAEGTSAEVETTVYFISPQAAEPLPFQRKTNWRLEDGEWRLFLPIVKPRSLENVYVPGQPLRKRSTAPAPVDLQFAENRVSLGTVYTDERPKVRFSFTNTSDHPVQIEVQTGCECLRAIEDDKTYQPGESGEVAIQFDPTGYLFFYKQTVTVKTEPGGRSHPLLIEARVLPAAARPDQ